MKNPDYLTLNRKAWNRRTELHVISDFYDNKGFIAGRNSLNDIELPLLGDVSGESILHLQCHFGQDTIALARMGAHCTGVDFAERAIEEARKLNEVVGTNVQFVLSDIYDLPNHLKGTFDTVFTSYGTIGWLPDVTKWVEVVNHFMKPGGRFVFVEFHPFVYLYDTQFRQIQYPYFNRGPIVEVAQQTYTGQPERINSTDVAWSHTLSDVIQNLINAGLSIEHFSEYDYSPHNCFSDTVEIAPGRYQIRAFGDKIPLVYAIVARK